MSLVMLNIAGGDCVYDLRVLEEDEGFVRALRQVERAVPSQSPVFRYLEAFNNPGEELRGHTASVR